MDTTPTTEDERERTANTESTEQSRRGLLRTTATVGTTLLVGGSAIGSAGAAQETGRFNDAPGRGGAAVVHEDDFEGDQAFRLTERTGDTALEIDFVEFQCSGEGEEILLVGWNFEYVEEDDPETRTLYTRSNNLDTDKEYQWRPQGNGAKLCEDGVGDRDFVQTPYRATGNQP